MATHFLKLRVMISDIYPKHIREMAEKLEIPVEEIARSRGISAGKVVDDWKRRDIIELVDMITEHPDHPDHCILNYVDGSFDTIAEPANKVARKIQTFLDEGGVYIFHHRLVYMTAEGPEPPGNQNEEDDDEIG